LVLSANAAPDVRVQLSVAGAGGNAKTPGVRSANELDVRVTDANEQPVANILRVIFRLSYLDSDTGIQRVDAEPRGDGHFRVVGNYVPLAGRWHVREIVRRRGVDDVMADFTFHVLPDTQQESGNVAPE
jgi:hypothetical protein